jgi:chromate reductase, NAD(P)H dehydrogenase (quinone)
MAKPRILVFSGSSRPGSLNQKLADLAARTLADKADVTAISLADFPMPFVDASLFGAAPANALKLRDVIDANHGLFISCPEYNAGYPAVLKNALDAATMAKPGAPATGLAGKVVGLGGVSPGAMGGYRAMTQFRTMLELGMGALVIPEMVAVGNGENAFNGSGALVDERTGKFFEAALARLVKEATKAMA